ncbi:MULTISPECIES: molecular chaperone DnaJ [Actinokineospora]|uniref:Chaperone protein DnaJ n=1 Tax=Actinokineospora fastidiosa TaxID=1816 RepID=A0A918G6E4_9PSEU|nr:MULTISPECIES: molecular chaperone DnaJ [Actinokineospora]UVS82517.1 Heat shock protein J [Actinokineospora sp. UTMC 2448]GGS20532.1 chaperone protein DnaJ [Actinokineospora fastidiosa]
MSARDWIDKDFYRELGVSSDASDADIKKAYRKLARELHPDANPGNTDAEARFKAVSEAYGVVGDPEKRKQYDEARSLFGGGFRPGGFGGAGGNFDFSDIFSQQQGSAGGGFGGLGDLFGNLFSRRGGGPSRPRRGADVETEVRIDFVEAVRGATVPLRLTSPATCETCHGSGARPGSTPQVCATCGGAGLVNRSQGAFAFSEPCRDCRGKGTVVTDPCPDCGGEGVATRTRPLTVRIPAGVEDEQRIRLAGQGEPGQHGAQAGDLYVRVHVTPHPVFGRNGDDLTLKVPVTFPELALGTTLTVPTLDSTVSLRVAPGTTSGRVLRVRGKGVARRDGRVGDLLVTLQVAVPATLDDDARAALEAYAAATADHDPRPDLTALVEKAR